MKEKFKVSNGFDFLVLPLKKSFGLFQIVFCFVQMVWP